MLRPLILTIDCPFGDGDGCPNKLTVDVVPPHPGSAECWAGYIQDAYGCDSHLDWNHLTQQQDNALWSLVVARLEEMSEP